MSAVRLRPVPFLDALHRAARSGVVLPDVYYNELVGAARARAFTVSGLANVEQIADVLESLLDAQRGGLTFAQWKDQVRSGKRPIKLPDHRLETIYRTNLQGWWMRGHAQEMREHQASHPYLLYSAVDDDRTRPDHAEMDGTILPMDHPWWDTHFPPNGYNCRCTAISLTEREAVRRGITNAPPAVDPDPGFEYSALRDIDDAQGVLRAVGRAESRLADIIQQNRSLASAAMAGIAQLAAARAAIGSARQMRDQVMTAIGGRSVWDRLARETEAARLSAGLTVDQAVVLGAYTDNGSDVSRRVQATMRYAAGVARTNSVTARELEPWLPVTGALRQAIRALPAAPGVSSRGIRSSALPRDWLAAHQVGTVVRYAAPMVAASATGRTIPGDVVLIIAHESGRALGGFAPRGLEGSLILPPGTMFRVVRRRTMKDGSVRIWLREVPPSNLGRYYRPTDL